MRVQHQLVTFALFMTMGCASVHAQAGPVNPILPFNPSPSAHLSASATMQVLHDWLVIRLAVQKEGADAALIQRQLKTTLAAALTQAQSEAKPMSMEVSTGQLNVSPRYNREGKTSGWVGTA